MYYLWDKDTETIKETDSVQEFGEWFESIFNRKVAETSIIHSPEHQYWVSTVALGVSHGRVEGEPLIFETRVFLNDDYKDIYTERYFTSQEAREGHQRICKQFRDLKKKLTPM